MLSIIRLPGGLQKSLNAATGALFAGPNERNFDFSRPPGEPALFAPDSLSWRVFKNPIALFIGGVAGVILELAEPSVRTGVWEHSSFRRDPLGRLQRTGSAAMVTVFGARSVAEPMIERVVRTHSKVSGRTPAGLAYSAADVQLLNWVHATATYGFAEAYSRFVHPLSLRERDELYREGRPASRLYGARGAPESTAELQALFDAMRGTLEPSSIVFEFLQIMGDTPAFPASLRWAQRLLVRAAVELIPEWLRVRLALSAHYGLRPGEGYLVRLAGAALERIVLPQGPAAQSCIRLGLPVTHLYSS